MYPYSNVRKIRKNLTCYISIVYRHTTVIESIKAVVHRQMDTDICTGSALGQSEVVTWVDHGKGETMYIKYVVHV